MKLRVVCLRQRQRASARASVIASKRSKAHQTLCRSIVSSAGCHKDNVSTDREEGQDNQGPRHLFTALFRANVAWNRQGSNWTRPLHELAESGPISFLGMFTSLYEHLGRTTLKELPAVHEVLQSDRTFSQEGMKQAFHAVADLYGRNDDDAARDRRDLLSPKLAEEFTTHAQVYSALNLRPTVIVDQVQVRRICALAIPAALMNLFGGGGAPSQLPPMGELWSAAMSATDVADLKIVLAFHVMPIGKFVFDRNNGSVHGSGKVDQITSLQKAPLRDILIHALGELDSELRDVLFFKKHQLGDPGRDVIHIASAFFPPDAADTAGSHLQHEQTSIGPAESYWSELLQSDEVVIEGAVAVCAKIRGLVCAQDEGSPDDTGEAGSTGGCALEWLQSLLHSAGRDCQLPVKDHLQDDGTSTAFDDDSASLPSPFMAAAYDDVYGGRPEEEVQRIFWRLLRQHFRGQVPSEHALPLEPISMPLAPQIWAFTANAEDDLELQVVDISSDY